MGEADVRVQNNLATWDFKSDFSRRSREVDEKSKLQGSKLLEQLASEVT